MRPSGPVLLVAPVAPVVSRIRSVTFRSGSSTVSVGRKDTTNGGTPGFVAEGGNPGCSCQSRRRQDRVGCFVLRVRVDVVRRLRRHGELAGLVEVRPGCPIDVDDAPGQEIPDRLSGFRLVHAEDVIEGAVFADDDDQMLDRATRLAGPLPALGIVVSASL